MQPLSESPAASAHVLDLMVLEENADQQPYRAAPAETKRPSPLRPHHSPIQLLQASSEPVVSIALSAKDLSLDDLDIFRQRAAELAGSHGLTLDKLVLNGEDASGANIGLTGVKSWR